LRVAVYIGTSIDGYISRDNGSVDWLLPFEDSGASERFEVFLSTVDTIVMGRNTFLHVLNSGHWWYHEIPVYVLSTKLTGLPESAPSTANLRNCSLDHLLVELTAKKCERIYVDGGRTVQEFFRKDLIDELTIARVPIILGSGRSLFGPVPFDLKYQQVSTDVFPSGIVQTKYIRVR
jgi:dihydrofolate reductase